MNTTNPISIQSNGQFRMPTQPGTRITLLAAVFDQLPNAVVLFDSDLRIVEMNQAAEKLFGIAAEDVIGKNHDCLFLCDSCASNCVVRQAGGHTSKLRIKSEGSRNAVVNTTYVRDQFGAIEGIVATIREVAEKPDTVMPAVIAESPAMRELLGVVHKVARSEAASILIEGENGSGKDLIAQMLHYQSARQSQPFLAINCAAIPESLLESELFGYEKGAFTDARAQKRGLFELADKGTLFLDEIGEIPLSLQAKLLRVLENQTFRRLGGLRDIEVDIRIVAATNRNLRKAVREGDYRMDLYYRLNVIQLTVPPLRNRPQDILPLARFFIEQFRAKSKRQLSGISSEAESALLAHDWPGNVRELRNAIQRAMILEEKDCIGPKSLNLPSCEEEAGYESEVPIAAGPLMAVTLAGQERRLIVEALERTDGNQSRAARLLQVTRDAMRYKMKKHNLQ